jgi:hypothetical protein
MVGVFGLFRLTFRCSPPLLATGHIGQGCILPIDLGLGGKSNVPHEGKFLEWEETKRVWSVEYEMSFLGTTMDYPLPAALRPPLLCTRQRR